MKSLLFLGGSRQQVPAIDKANELGIRTVLVDYLIDNPGQYVADKWYCESTTDVEAVYRIAKEENVNGILAYASDPAALPAAIVCERLGLPTNPVISVEILCVKHKFRKFLQDNGFIFPSFFSFSSDTSLDKIKKGISSMKLPIVVKPTDSSGSKGVTLLNSFDNINEAIRIASCYSRNNILIAEEFIERGYPYVIGGDIFVVDGHIKLFGDMECLRDDEGKSFIPIGEKRPNGLNAQQKETLYSELQHLVTALGIKFGELNIELLIDKNGKPNFLELGPRAGGNMIPIQLSDAYGINLIEANIKAALGEPIILYPNISNDAFMTFVLHSHGDGVLYDIEYSPDIEPYIYRKVIYKEIGDRIESFDSAGKALGIIFLKFPTIEIMNSIESQIDNLIRVKLQ